MTGTTNGWTTAIKALSWTTGRGERRRQAAYDAGYRDGLEAASSPLAVDSAASELGEQGQVRRLA